jgi:hypothetical protein
MTQPPSDQQWLSLSGICDKLRLTAGQVRTLVNKGCLATIGKKGTPAYRYLDPTPEYKEQLRMGAIIHQRHYPIPAGLTEKALLTNSECREILGMSAIMMKRYLKRNHIPSIKVTKTLFLYSPAVVREALLKRSKKTLHRNLAPFLLSEMVELFRSRLLAEVSLIPTDKEFRADEALQRRLAMIVTESQKADFARKVKLAQQIVQILESVNSSNPQ